MVTTPPQNNKRHTIGFIKINITIQMKRNHTHSRSYKFPVTIISSYLIFVLLFLNFKNTSAAVDFDCNPPSGLVASEITATSAKLDWEALTGTIIYKIAYRKTGTGKWMYSGSRINTRSIYGLIPSSAYEFQVQTACSSDDSSSFSTSGYFTTKSPCNIAPARLFACDIDTSSALLSWTDLDSSVTYKIKHSIIGSGDWTENTSPNNSKAITGLATGKNYEFQVQGICPTGNSSYSTSYNFSTTSSSNKGPVNIDVDMNTILSTISSHPIGINMNYLMDDDTYLNPATSTITALSSMGVKFLRFPGGEKSDSYLWATPPYTRPNHTLARTGPFEWPASDYNFVQNDYKTLNASTLDFDEFMATCMALGADPIITVSYDGMFGLQTPGGTIPTRAQLLSSAEAWVHYANITKGYNIKYWMIGNESYNTNMFSYNGNTTKENYRDDIIEFSNRMKAIDPNIKIVANGEGDDWWQTVLEGASGAIDYLAINNFPVWQYPGGYEYYSNNTPELVNKITTAANAISAYSTPADKAKLKIIITEFNSMDWGGSWENTNDMGHAMISFEIAGEQLKKKDIEATAFWTTRWVDNDKMTDIAGALDKNGGLTANGKAISIWGNFLGKKMVSSGSTTFIRTFASTDSSSNKLYIYMINKGKTQSLVNLNLNGFISNSTAKIWELKGSGPFDKNPIWSQKEGFDLTTSNLTLNLSSVSITLVEITPNSSTEVDKIPGSENIPNNGFEVSPNPSSGKVHVKYVQDSNTNFTITVSNINGQTIYKNSFKNVLDEFIDLNKEAPGIYFIQMNTENRIIRKKVVIQQ